MKYLITLASLLITASAYAALAPRYQNEKDLKVMMEYVLSKPDLITTLKTIDFDSKSIYFDQFDGTCKAEFGRAKAWVPKPAGWVGPANKLVLKHTNCDFD